MTHRRAWIFVALGITALAACSWLSWTRSGELACGDGFARVGSRCCATSKPAPAPGMCAPAEGPCPAPLVASPEGCDAPAFDTVSIERTSVQIGPSDWEAEGRVAPRVLSAGPFRIDRFEVTVGHAFCRSCPLPRAPSIASGDLARAASEVSLSEARTYCRARGGRLPTEDEWMIAAAGGGPRRYPWGDTGAVCRRAAWGLVNGPCASGAIGPDTVGAHPDGRTPDGVHDLAGNVAEWVERNPNEACGDTCLGTGVVHGGAWDTALATDLRTWRRSEVPVDTRSSQIGFRCVYDVEVP